MPMNGDDMATEIVAALETIPSVIPDGSDTSSTLEIWKRVAGAIVTYIQANADVSVTVPVEPADVALQTSTTVGTPTAGPAVPTSLDGTGGIS